MEVAVSAIVGSIQLLDLDAQERAKPSKPTGGGSKWRKH